ncbi:hypothetical protein ABB37_03950 [Leptomonas pyrrhocoris]|uniref:Uncharacterized protein n=1 Tax=Leptomonas pyrrhocoris TaxID=157538 RepID=A0A0M9G3Q7_LEPPY|nr:hypothetical protein ABB37_03950 [Leptomonas pyrrhocoris]XP_015660062.1 hypothetical protein ABB37_03950 [Leptomonas pyrrhocoris]KPA81622.1 hypothetical protein ABB37_03950 [Leptomonas pyrrhocoris]KPA81623.1 hypothetical protein ABB37_03950 [Leptomonas pyrrhocoris]|eukprot:XP_015660061.1 hypothetical protein ABB37_03950 [Leptomonas pyrrhocoris]
MPAKKKGARSKSAGGAAAKGDAAHDALLQRQAEDREFVRGNETSLRRQIDEEERSTFEAYRRQEAVTRHRVEEAVRKAQFEARENELVEEVKQKAEQLQETQEALSRLQQASELLQSEKASALRRIALLSNELELAQVNVVELERRATSADQGHRDALKKLEGEFDALQQKYHELEAQYAALESQMVAKASEAAANEEKAAAEEGQTPEMPPGEAEKAALLRVMQTEVERYKATATQLQEDLTHARREEEKSNLLVGVLNTQLESVREDNRRLHELSLKRASEVEAAGQVRREAQEARRTALAEMDQALSTAAVQQRQLQLELDVHRKEAEKLAKELSALREEHAALTEELAQLTQKAAQQAQSDLATNVAMQAELANQKKDLELALKAKAAAEDEKFNHKLLTRAEIESLKARLQRLQETMERNDRESFETITVLRADAAKQESMSEQETKEHLAEVTDLHEKLLLTLKQNEALLNALDTLQKTSTQREHDLYEQLTSITAHHTTSSEELERLRTSATQKEAEYTHNFVCMNAERENLRTKLNEMTEASAEYTRMHSETVEQMRMQMEELKSRLTAEAEAHKSACAKESARADVAERNTHRLQDHVRDLEYNVRLGNESHDEAVKTLQAESRDLRSELSIAKRTIVRLENALGDLASYRQLTELNDRLTKDYEKAQQTITALNGKVVLLQNEADTMGGYTVRKAQEEKEQLTRRLRQVERRYKLMAPPFNQLRSFAESRLSPALHTELIAALEAFDQESAFISKYGVTDGTVTNEVKPSENKAAAESAAAETTDFVSTIPSVAKPRLPSAPQTDEKARYTLRKPQSIRSGIIAARTNAAAESRDRLPAIA